MNWGKNIKMAGAVAVGAAGLLTNMSPASAAGSGTSMGESTINEAPGGNPVCAEARNSAVITLHNEGTFQVGTSTPFVGATKATFTASSGFWFNPAGTFTDATCTIPKLVPGNLAVVTEASLVPGAPANVGTVTCSQSIPNSASYTRQAGNAFAVTSGVGFTCTVNGVTAATTLTFTGNQNPCFGTGFPLPLPDPCTVPNTELVGGYTQAP